MVYSLWLMDFFRFTFYFRTFAKRKWILAMNDKPNKLKSWLLAARPKTLTGALVPVLLAGALCHRDGCLSWLLILLCALFASWMQIAANFINDLFDYLRGTDREDRLGPERACAQGWLTAKEMQWGIFTVLYIAAVTGLGAVALTWESLPYHGWEFIVLGAACFVFAFLYTTCLSYLGLGDLLVLVFFGLVPVCGTYYLMAHKVSADAVLCGLISGFCIDALLVVNNYRDREQDKLSGKRTLVVLLGERFGSYLYLAVGIIAATLTIILNCGAAGVPYLILHTYSWRKMERINKGKALNGVLGETSRNMLILAVLCAVRLYLITPQG